MAEADHVDRTAAGSGGRAARAMRRLTLMTLAAGLLLGAGLPAAVRMLNLIKMHGFPLGFYVVAQLAPVLLAALALAYAARARTLDRRRLSGGAKGSPGTREAGSALLVATMLACLLPLAGASGGLAWQGFDGLWLGLGLATGVLLYAVLMAGPLARAAAQGPVSGSGGPLAVLGFASGADATRVAVLLVALPALLLLLASQLAALAAVGRVVGLAPPVATAGAAGAVLALALLQLTGGGLLAVAGLAATAALGVVVLAAALAMAATGSVLAPAAYGPLIPEIGRLEVTLLSQKLADAAAMKAHATPYAAIDVLNFWGGVLGTAFGAAVLLGLSLGVLAPRPAAGGAEAGRGTAAWSLVFLLPFLVLLPAIAVFAKAGLFQALTKGVPVAALPGWLLDLARAGWVTICGAAAGTAESASAACKAVAGHKGVLRLQDLGLAPGAAWLATGPMTGTGPWVSALPIVVASLASLLAGSVALLAAAVALQAVAPGAAPGTSSARPAGTGLVALGLLGGAAALAVMLPEEAAGTALWPLPMLAGGLAAPLLLALWWRRATPTGLAAGVVTGAAVTLYYLVGTRYFPVSFHDLWHAFTPTSFGAEQKYVSLRDAWSAAEASGDVDRTAAAWQALRSHAQGISGIWGLRPAAAAVLGLPAGLLATIVVSLLTRAPSPELRALRDRWHDPRTDAETRTDAAMSGAARAVGRERNLPLTPPG